MEEERPGSIVGRDGALEIGGDCTLEAWISALEDGAFEAEWVKRWHQTRAMLARPWPVDAPES